MKLYILSYYYSDWSDWEYRQLGVFDSFEELNKAGGEWYTRQLAAIYRDFIRDMKSVEADDYGDEIDDEYYELDTFRQVVIDNTIRRVHSLRTGISISESYINQLSDDPERTIH